MLLEALRKSRHLGMFGHVAEMRKMRSPNVMLLKNLYENQKGERGYNEDDSYQEKLCG
jgi:hypothetical protein